MYDWKQEDVTDHSGGITDLVTASGSEFQEICRNLTNNFKIQMLSLRDGYRRFTTQTTPTKIRQLFKLEDWLIAYCYAEPANTTAQVSGKLYYRLESDTSSAWTEVQTPKDRSTSVVFRVYDSSGKGFTVTKSAPTYDQLVVASGSNGAGPTYAPVISGSSRTITIAVATARLDATTKKYARGGALGNLKWGWFDTAFPAGWTVSRFSGTLSTDEVVFDEILTVQTNASDVLGIYPANARSDGNGTAVAFVDEQGHLQASDWQSHLYLALEPYIKTFTANTSDPDGEDPDTYPPDNNRLPLRKIAPIKNPIGDTSGYTLKAFNAQLPKTYIGVNSAQSTENATYDSTVQNYRYQVYRIRWDYKSGAYSSDTTGSIEIWAERTWGQVGAPGAMTNMQYLAYEFLTGTANPIDAANPFSVADYNVSAVAAYAPIIGIGTDWGKLWLCMHDGSPATIESITYEDLVAYIRDAFTAYQSRGVDIGGTTYYATYRNFGFYIKTNAKAKTTELMDISNAYVDSWYADTLPEDVAGNYRYGYAFYLRDSYTASYEGAPRQFTFDGPVSFLEVRTLSPIGLEPLIAYSESTRTNAYSFSSAPLVYGGIAARMDRSTDLYFQSTIDAVFARTLNGGDVYYIDQSAKWWYRTGDITAPTLPQALIDDGWSVKTAYVVPHQSETTDSDEQFNEQAYFNGGVLGYDSLPQGPYYFTIVNQIGYALNIVNNIQRLYQSTPGIPHATPASLFEDFDDEGTGVTSFLDKPIITTQNRLWRVEGNKSSDGAGRTFLRTISDEYGCIANQSIVVTNVGVFLWSNSGIIYTDGLKAFRVTEHLIGTYNDWLATVRASTGEIGPKQLRGRFDELNRLIYWSLYDEDSKPFFVVLSLQKGLSSTMPVTTHDGVRFQDTTLLGVVTDTDYFQTHATLYSDDTRRWYRSQDTYLMYADSDRTYDESHVTGLKHPILPYYKSVAFAYGIPWARKQTIRAMFTLQDRAQTGVSFRPLGWNDLGETPEKLTACLNYQHLPFDTDYTTGSLLDLEQFFRHTDCRFKTETVISYKRHFGKGQIRNCFKQVGFEALAFKYATWEPFDVTGITAINVVMKAAFPQTTVFIQVTVTDHLSNPVIDIGLDKSGQFLVAWEEDMDPVPVSTVSLSGSTYTIIVLPDTANPTNLADYTERWPTIRWYRYFYDQKIDMIGYNLTYRLIGDRTHGALKSSDKGGVNA